MMAKSVQVVTEPPCAQCHCLHPYWHHLVQTLRTTEKQQSSSMVVQTLLMPFWTVPIHYPRCIANKPTLSAVAHELNSHHHYIFVSQLCSLRWTARVPSGLQNRVDGATDGCTVTFPTAQMPSQQLHHESRAHPSCSGNKWCGFVRTYVVARVCHCMEIGKRQRVFACRSVCSVVRVVRMFCTLMVTCSGLKCQQSSTHQSIADAMR
jgi:hypothetical protein